MRHFEITAAGGFMLCGHQAEIDRYFKVGTECDTFTSERELLDKVRYYLAHPDQRREIALAGQRRTLSEHLYSHRLKTLMDMVQAGQAADQAAPATASR
jgi:spore maturation protein CgeB